MIEKLLNANEETANEIHSLFQKSYKIEGELLGATDFPPLKRPIKDYIKTRNEFFGYKKNGELAGIIEISDQRNYTDIFSLVVDPQFFRQGIATALIGFTISTFESNLYVVETGVDNLPACNLYRKFGFQEVKQWDTKFGIRKVAFELELGTNSF